MLRILAVNTLSAGLVTLLTAVHGGWPSLLTSFLVSLIYANAIGTGAQLLLPWMAAPAVDGCSCRGWLLLPWMACRLEGRPPAAYWLSLGATLFGLAVVGALLSGALAGALGLLKAGTSWAALRTGFGVAVVITMSVGLAITLYERTRARLDDARERLQARELEMERAQRLASEARLVSLESRLHPHFVFNAIAAIAGQVREAPEHAERLLVEFADLLRASLDSTQRHTVPLEDEMAIARSYLEIEQARLGERLRCKLDLPDELRGWPMPPFALHTLVQNSVKHVAAARVEGAEVRVEAWRVGDRLGLSVWDDGRGSIWTPCRWATGSRRCARAWPCCSATGRRWRPRVKVAADASRCGWRPTPSSPSVDDGAAARLRGRRRARRAAAGRAEPEIVGPGRRDGHGDLWRNGLLEVPALDIEALFLDIHMPGMNGFELLERLAVSPLVVFVTAHDAYALQAFETSAIDYLLKPVKRERLERTLDRLERRRGDPTGAGAQALLEKLARHYLQARPPVYADRVSLDLGQQRTQLVEVVKITHFLAQGKGTVAVTAAGGHLVDRALGELEGRLDPRQFIRIHRSAIVNLTWVAEVQPDLGGRLVVRLRDAPRTELPVARERARALKKRLVL